MASACQLARLKPLQHVCLHATLITPCLLGGAQNRRPAQHLHWQAHAACIYRRQPSSYSGARATPAQAAQGLTLGREQPLTTRRTSVSVMMLQGGGAM